MSRDRRSAAWKVMFEVSLPVTLNVVSLKGSVDGITTVSLGGTAPDGAVDDLELHAIAP